MNPTWQTDDGRVKLWLGDCLDVLPTLEAGSVDAVVTDPPYGIGIANNPFRQKYAKQDWDDKPAEASCIQAIVASAKEAIVWGGNYFDLPPTQCVLIWDKVQPENFSSAMVEVAWTNLSRPAKMFRHRVVGYTKEHPTAKPEELMEWCLSYVPKAESVFDPFMGSGTTGVACVRLGRKFLGVEKEPKYFEIAKRRIIAELERMPLFEEKPSYTQTSLIGSEATR